MRFLRFSTIAVPILFAASAQLEAQTETRSASKVAAVLARIAQDVVGKNVEDAKVTNPWASNEEVATVRQLDYIDRTAVLFRAILLYNENEKKIFKKATATGAEFNAMTGARMGVLRKLRSLLVESNNLSEQILRDYIDGDLLDLRLLVSGKIGRGIYSSTLETRNAKLETLMMMDVDIGMALFEREFKKDNLARALSAKTMLITLIEVCSATPDVCESL